MAEAAGEMRVIVRKIDGEEVLTCSVDPEKQTTVLDMKQLVAEKTGIAVDSQILTHAASILDDSASLEVVAQSKQEDCIELTLQIRTACGKYLVTLCNEDYRTVQFDHVCGHYVFELHGDTLQLKYSSFGDHVESLEKLPLRDLGQRAVTWEDDHTFKFYTQEFLGDISVTFEEADAAPLGMKFREHDLAVTQITAGRPAASKGIQLGDLLRTINTTDVSKCGTADLRPLLQARPLQLVFKRWAEPGMAIRTPTEWKNHDIQLESVCCNLHLRVRFEGCSPEDKVSIEVVDSEGNIESWKDLTINYIGPLDE
eukprot:TRINITY_DN46757_c0_g1_i1.p1 TRINITY_DN46757_c0_g1~~TRINITY_DN46757_c0_g1_i1.p1  ORF type:complete len:330 (+),score=26.88 TRINITY_DN46757_c0_g1_i1:55-990(+)